MSRPRHFRPDLDPDPPKRRRTWKQRILLSTGCAVILVCLSGLSVAGYVLVKYNSIERFGDLDIDEAPPGEPRNYLLVGSDGREGLEGQRTDTIMVVRVDPAEEQASVLSFPRDLVIPIAGTGETGRINSAYAMEDVEAGRQRLIDTLRQNFAIEIHHYVEVSFDGFGLLVDAVGGVPLWFGSAVRDRESGFYNEQLGCVTLDGEQALQFVRSRYFAHLEDGEWTYDQTADLGRITRQQIFIEEALTQTMAEIRSNPTKLRQLIDIGVATVGIDDRLGISDIQDLAGRFRDFDTEQLRTYSLPVVDRGDSATVALSEREAEPILNVFRGLDPGEISPDLVTVRVLNGTGLDGQANDVAGALQAIGFDMVEPGNLEPAGTTVPHTVVRHHPDDEAAAVRVARHITGGADVTVDLAVEEGVVEVVTGTDFTTVHEEPTPVDQMPTTTTTAPPDAPVETTEAPAETTTTTAPTTTTTRPTQSEEDRPGVAVGRPPPNRDC